MRLKTLKAAAAAAVTTLSLGAFAPSASAQAEMYLGQVFQAGFDYCPTGSMMANGQILSISQNSALFALLGTMYGGNGTTTFALPDLRGRSIIHYGTGPGLSAVTMGQVSGAESVTLTIQNMPAHNHQLLFDTGAIASSAVESVERGLSDPVDVPALSQPGANTSNSTTVTGSNAPVSIRSPYLAMNTCIATQGIWPSRP